MISRLASVLFWIGLVGSVVTVVVLTLFATNTPHGMGPFQLVLVLVVATIPYVLGWAMRFILTGKKGLL